MNRYVSILARGRLVALFVAGMVTVAQAAPQTLTAQQRPGELSTFTLDFGAYGGERQAQITATEFQVEVDADAGTARFVNYHQDVDPLILPGDISTGNITVEIVPGSSTGTYDAATGEFFTSEFYAIYFEGDLSAYGLESPVFLPSASSGVVEPVGVRFGRIDLNWDGEGQLNNPFDPSTPITFTYTCEVSAAYGYRQLAPVADPDAQGRAGPASEDDAELPAPDAEPASDIDPADED